MLQDPAAHYVRADLSCDGEPERLAAEAWDHLGSIDVLVNNLGIYREPPLLELTRDHFELVFRLNVWVAIALTREVVRRAIAARRGGRILFSTSLNGLRSEPLHSMSVDAVVDAIGPTMQRYLVGDIG